MTSRIGIISDTHLGRPRGRLGSAAALAPLWQCCTELIINGDVAEIHHREWCGRAAREVMALQERCDADGVQLTLLSGNHDPMLSDDRFRKLAGGAVLVMHGDAVHPSLAPWAPTAERMRRAHEAALAALTAAERDDLRTRLSACQHAAHAEWLESEEHYGLVRKLLGMAVRPWVVWKILQAWREFPHQTAAYAEAHAPEARYVLVGHVHRPSITEIGERVVINTGSFDVPGPPRLVIVEPGRLAVFAVRRRRGQWQPATRPLASFPVPEAADEVPRFGTFDVTGVAGWRADQPSDATRPAGKPSRAVGR